MPIQFMMFLRQIAEVIQTLQSTVANCCKWLTLLMVVVTAAIVALRAFDIGSTAMQESVTYMHAVLFMMTLAYTGQIGGHVRVDVFYRKASALGQAWINLIGSLIFLLPFAVFMIAISWPTMAQSWGLKEASIHPGGLPFVYLLKTLPPLAGVLLTLHAIADIMNQLLKISLTDEEQNP
jgi:TRAP-type mannitol/chloroaromatic compound transport system permease small subunit